MEEEVKKWIEKANRDLFASEINFNERLYEVSAFLSHQAVEKGLKALYILKFKKLWKVHDLEELSLTIKANKRIVKICKELNPHYIETRYPVETEYTKEITENALKNAKEVLKWVEEKLKKSKKE